MYQREMGYRDAWQKITNKSLRGYTTQRVAMLLALYLTRSSGACTRVGRNFLRIHGDLYILHEYHPCINMGINGGTLGRKQPRGNGNSELGAKLS